MATQMQLGMQPQMNESIVLVFFATILNYNFHKLYGIRSLRDNDHSEQYLWATSHKTKQIILIGIASVGFILSGMRIHGNIWFVLLPLAVISLFYTISFSGKRKYWLSKIPGLKTFMIAFVWAFVTIFIPAFQAKVSLHQNQILLLFMERFTYIFALAIPFDIRDMKTDSIAGIKTIPIAWGAKRAILLCNSMMALSALIAFYQLHDHDLWVYIPAYLLPICITALVINSQKLKKSTYYYTGWLDGCLLLNGALICVTYLLFI